MNTDTIAGNWKQLTGEIQKQWGKLTNDNVAQINGSRKKLIGSVQETYGIARDEAEKQVAAWEKAFKQ